MALSLPLLIANMLGMSGAAYLSGRAQRSATEKYEADKWQRQVMKEALFKGVFESGTLPPRPALVNMLGGGSSGEQMADMLGQIVESQQQRRAANNERFQQVLGRFGGGSGGMVPNYFAGREGVEPLSPEQQTAFGHLQTPPQGGPQALGPGPSAPLALPAAAGEAEPQLVQRAPDAMGEGAPPSGDIDLAPPSGLRPAMPPLRRAAPTMVPGRAAQPSISIHEDSEGKQSINITMPSTEERGRVESANLMSQAFVNKVTPGDLKRAAGAAGILLNKDTLDSYEQYHWATHARRYIERATGRPYGAGAGQVLPNSSQMAIAAAQYAAENGAIPNKDTLMALAAGEKGEGTALMFFPFAQNLLAQIPELTMSQVLTAFRNATGQAPPAEAQEQFRVMRRERAMREIASAASASGQSAQLQNPNWLMRELLRRDEGLLTEQERTQARALQDIGKPQAERATRAGFMPGPAAELKPLQPTLPGQVVIPEPTPKGQPVAPPQIAPPQAVPPGTPGATPIFTPPVPPGQTPAEVIHQDMLREESEQAGKTTESREKGQQRGVIAMAPHMPVHDTAVLSTYVDPTDWSMPQPGILRGDLDQAVKNRQFFPIPSRQHVMGLASLDTMIQRADTATDVLMPLWAKHGGFMTWVKSLGITGFTLPRVGYQILGGALSDSAQKSYVQMFVKKGVSADEATKIVQAMSDIIYLQQEGPLLLRNLGVRGVTAVHVIKEEVKSLPGLHENSATIQAKMAALHSLRAGAWATAGLPVRYSVRGPQGEYGYWRPDKGPMLPGWSVRYGKH